MDSLSQTTTAFKQIRRVYRNLCVSTGAVFLAFGFLQVKAQGAPLADFLFGFVIYTIMLTISTVFVSWLLRDDSVKRAWCFRFFTALGSVAYLCMMLAGFVRTPTVLWRVFFFDLGFFINIGYFVFAIWAYRRLSMPDVLQLWKNTKLVPFTSVKLQLVAGLILALVGTTFLFSTLGGALAQKAIDEARNQAPAGANFLVTQINVIFQEGRNKVRARVIAYDDSGQFKPIDVQFEN